MSSGMPFLRNSAISLKRLLGAVTRRRAREEAEAPLRRQRAAAAVEVITTNRVQRRRPGEDEHLDAFGVDQRLD